MQRLVMVVCASLLFVPVALRSRSNQDVSGGAAFRVSAGGLVQVRVGGFVRHQGVYSVSANTMADSVIIMADPARSLQGCRHDNILGQPLRNGAALSLDIQSDGTCIINSGNMTVQERLVLGIPLDITVMNETDFDRLPGIGPVLARKIMQYRQNNGGLLRIEDLASVAGIGERKFNALKAYFQPAENNK